MNNMVLFQNVIAISEALVTAERSRLSKEIFATLVRSLLERAKPVSGKCIFRC
jgi:3-hydroxyisobutyrate dehydrogenase-like beta-hydroxyacid dehydrogenase